ncbi:sugar phosphorylase [Deferribacterales bacterium Es71-Z0220]|uniref:sugar phosphorylase n=1 Tax=Deferrivibrio essentukiensis TaxID=2880922 RepID=UPI001F61E426|nr:sugar phosphorylase [Deferrivibrio essentukiensis]MCB4203871.1 sugar phosphorylase [Deferrivibrio essentukiensis]
MNEPDYSKELFLIPPKYKGKILNRLFLLYGSDTGKKIYGEIERLVKVHHAYIKKGFDFIPENREKFTSRDTVLITYGDMIVGGNKKPLKHIADFCKKYLKNVFNSVHILPFYPYSSDRGFSVKNFTEVDHRIGTWEDIHNLSKEFSLMFDGVFNHISSKSAWFQSFLNGDPEFRDFFITISTSKMISEEHLKLIVRPRTTPLFTEFLTIDGPKLVWTTFSSDQIDLNFRNPKVLTKMIQILLFYVRMGASLIRLDAVTYLWEELGTECAHLKETHAIIKLFRDILDITAPYVKLVTETNVPHEKNIQYFGNGYDEAQMVYNFALPPLVLHAFLREDTTVLSKWASTIDSLNDYATFFNFLDSHDGIGVLPVSGILDEREINYMVLKTIENGGYISYRTDQNGEEVPYELNITWYSALNGDSTVEDKGIKKFIASRAIALSLVGVPGVYIHGLLGTKNDGEAVLKEKQTRSINRKVFKYKEIKEILDDKDAIQSKILNLLTKLIAIRSSEKAFSPNFKQKIFEIDNRLFCVFRYLNDEDECILSITNVSDDIIKIDLSKFKKYFCSDKNIDIVSGREILLNQNFLIEGYQVIWIKGSLKGNIQDFEKI